MSVARVLAGETRWHVEHGDALDVLRAMPDASVDAAVTDPPAGIAFMGKGWDTDKGGRAQWIAWLAEIMREALRALKPGGHALVWALPRTSHWTATAIEDAGFEVRDVVTHLFGQGFPKSLDVGKAIDKAAGAERPIVGSRKLTGRAAQNCAEKGGTYTSGAPPSDGCVKSVNLTAPATPLAEQWSGWGTALKPASEHWILARKPLAGTVAANVLAHGTGAINVDACRIAAGDAPQVPAICANAGARFAGVLNGGRVSDAEPRTTSASRAGRWPSNVTLSHLPECREVGTRKVRGSHSMGAGTVRGVGYQSSARGKNSKDTDHTNPDGTETVPAFDCAPGCAVAALDEQSGTLHTHGGTMTTKHVGMGYGGGNGSARVVEASHGGASRFFYCPKALQAERHAGLLPRGNRHNTVKPLALMRWLVRLITPPGGIVLDPFNGSGSTGCACVAEGLRYVGIEREAEYVEIARARIAHHEREVAAPAKPKRATKPRAVPVPPPSAPHPVDERQLDLLARLA